MQTQGDGNRAVRIAYFIFVIFFCSRNWSYGLGVFDKPGITTPRSRNKLEPSDFIWPVHTCVPVVRRI